MMATAAAGFVNLVGDLLLCQVFSFGAAGAAAATSGAATRHAARHAALHAPALPTPTPLTVPAAR